MKPGFKEICKNLEKYHSSHEFFFLFLATPRGLQDLSSRWTQAQAVKAQNPNN